MRITELIEDPIQRWDIANLDFGILLNSELERIIEITQVAIDHERDTETNRPMSRSEKNELNKICRKAANGGKRLTL